MPTKKYKNSLTDINYLRFYDSAANSIVCLVVGIFSLITHSYYLALVYFIFFFFVTISIIIVKKIGFGIFQYFVIYSSILLLYCTIPVVYHLYPLTIFWLLIPLFYVMVYERQKYIIFLVIIIAVSGVISIPYWSKFLLIHNYLFIDKIYYNYYLDLFLVISFFIVIILIFNSYNKIRSKFEEKLIQKNAEVLESQENKDRFFSNINHELRTPMNAIVGLSETLTNSKHYTYVKETIDSINLASNNLMIMLNDLLELTKFNHHEIKLEIKPINIFHSLPFIYNLFINKASENNTNLLIDIDEKIDQNLKGDQNRLNQVLMNVVSNAIKYTRNGDVFVSAKLISETTEVQNICFAVKDTGLGIDEQFMKDIFNPFTREYKNAEFDGTGLGMSIVKNIVDLMHGNIVIKSEKNIGTLIEINIPFDKNKGEVNEEITNQVLVDNYPEIDNLRILLIEDSAWNRLVVREFLKDNLVVINEVESAEDALEFLKTTNVDIILLDIGLPNMDGLTFASITRNELKLDIPIIALTANTTLSDNDFKSNGINGVLIKPFKRDELLDLITCYLI